MKLTRYEMYFDGEPQHIGFLNGISDTGMPIKLEVKIMNGFESLHSPELSELNMPPGTYHPCAAKFYFTPEGIKKYKKQLLHAQRAIRSRPGWSMRQITCQLDDLVPAYIDKYQIAGVRRDEVYPITKRRNNMDKELKHFTALIRNRDAQYPRTDDPAPLNDRAWLDGSSMPLYLGEYQAEDAEEARKMAAAYALTDPRNVQIIEQAAPGYIYQITETGTDAHETGAAKYVRFERKLSGSEFAAFSDALKTARQNAGKNNNATSMIQAALDMFKLSNHISGKPANPPLTGKFTF